MKRFAASLAFAAGLVSNAGAGYYATPALPIIDTNNIIVVTNPVYGAVGDNLSTNTTAIQNAINAAAAGGLTNGAAGGTVEIPAATNAYLCGPLTLQSSVNLQIDAGAILRMLPLGMYPGGTNTGTSFLSANNLHDVEISGFGAIDGQGAAWWAYPSAPRAIMISPSDCNRLLIENVTLSNSPMFHIAISGSHAGNSTVQNVTIRAPSTSPNTDACDVIGTNVLVQNCNISEGDDDFTCGGGTSGVLLTNNTYGTGHGISIGSYTDDGGVSNITVINCTMNGTANGIRIKSDDGRGGLVQNITYENISMTNVDFPIQIYAYYEEVGTPDNISPYYAATQAVAAVSSTTPIYNNITFSNIYATSVHGYPIGIVWARTEMPATNIIFDKVNITGDRNFELYNVKGAQFIDCNLQTSATSNTFAMFDAQAIITNSIPTNTLFTFTGLITNGYANTLTLNNARGSLENTNGLDGGPLALAASTFTVSNSLVLAPATPLDFTPGTVPAQLAVAGSLALGGTVNLSAGNGFSNGIYTLITYTGALSGALPTLGVTPGSFNYIYSFNTNTPGQVDLVATLPAPTNLVAVASNLLINLAWNPVAGAASYNLKRGTSNGGPYPTVLSGLAATNYADANLTNAVKYYYVVSAVGAGGESSNSLQAAAAPLPSNQPTNLLAEASGGQLQLSWPQDHQGWRLEIQTNALGMGLGSNWVTVPNSTNVTAAEVPLNPTNGAVFLRLVYP